MRRILNFVPLAILLAIFLYWTLDLVYESIQVNDGYWIYALDDPYIHMTIAKNLFQHGTWGISPETYASASSSFLWPILNAVIFWIVGLNDRVSLVLNFFFAVMIIFMLYRISLQLKLPTWLGAFLILPVIILAPLPAMVLTGMEHVAHLAISLAVISLALGILKTEQVTAKQGIILSILVFSLSAIRYEGVFLGFTVVGCLLFQRRIKLAAVLSLMVVLPVFAYGLLSVANGWDFIPNPILIKSDAPSASLSVGFIRQSIEHGLWRLAESPEMLWLLGLSSAFLVLGLVFRKREYRSHTWLHFMIVGMLVPHILWAGFGWFYRYEMYLMAIGIFLILVTLGRFVLGVPHPSFWRYGWRIIAALVLLFAAGSSFTYRNQANEQVVTATSNIYQQQYQMARFLAQYYPDEPVAINDIGAISFYTDVEVIDLWGLANQEVSRQVIQGDYDTGDILDVTKSAGVKRALVYDSWFQWQRSIPNTWIPAGQWVIPNNVVCGDAMVTFYALEESTLDGLVNSMANFSTELPQEVIQRGLYMTQVR